MRIPPLTCAAFAIISIALGCGADPKPLQSAGSEEKKASAIGEKAPSDEAQVRGHWICVEYSENGRTIPNSEIHALFTDKELKLSYSWGAAVYEYRFDPQSSPKHCDLTRPRGPGVFYRAIYSLEGGKLRLCTPMVVNNNTPYPTSLEPGKGHVTYTFKRLEKEVQRDEALLSLQQKEALAGQRKEMAENIKRLEEKNYSEFMEHIFPPEARDAIKKRKNGTEEMLKYAEERGPMFAQLLRTLLTEIPTFNSDATRATYDLREIHFNGLPGQPNLTLIKAGDHWYVEESNRGRQEK
jgi:uncharacterized protein (TIGR03067 family)